MAVNFLFADRGVVSAIAREMRVPVGTVWCWKKAGSIPVWRRPTVLDAVKRLRMEMPDEVLAYLAKAD